MKSLALILFLTVSLSTASLVLLDSYDCRHLKCHWEGIGEHCNPSLHKSYKKGQCSLSLEPRYKGQTDAELIELMKLEFRNNAFTIDDSTLDKKCEKKKLCCNVDSVVPSEDWDMFVNNMQNSDYSYLPKPPCSLSLSSPLRAKRSAN